MAVDYLYVRTVHMACAGISIGLFAARGAMQLGGVDWRRWRWLRIAPHLVRPLPFLWPVYRGARVNRLMLAAALTAYDALALFRNVGRHKRLSVRAALAVEPALAPEALVGAARYFDAATDDARLTLSNALAAQSAGAVLVNHAHADGLLRENGRVVGARVHDKESGERIEVRASATINAAGPWSDRVEALVDGAATRGVHGSKGVHINVPRERVGNVQALTLIAPQDGRVMFVLPAGAFTIIGTTDTFDDVAPETVHAREADVAYLIAAVNHFFPKARLTDADVVSAWAGIRPLAYKGTGDSPGSASREHAISETSAGFIRVTGGKLTTYRSMSAEVVDVALRSIGRAPGRSRTADIPLPGGDIADLPALVRAATGVIGSADIAERLVHAQGSGWRAIWSLAETEPALAGRLDESRPYVLAELRFAIEQEMARTLGDLLIRRMPLAFELRDHGRGVAARIAAVVCGWLGHPAERIGDLLVAYDLEIARMFVIDP